MQRRRVERAGYHQVLRRRGLRAVAVAPLRDRSVHHRLQSADLQSRSSLEQVPVLSERLLTDLHVQIAAYVHLPHARHRCFSSVDTIRAS